MLETSPLGTLLKGSFTIEPIVLPSQMPVKEFENGFEEETFDIDL